MTESEKRTIILDFVAKNPTPDQSITPNIVININGNSKKYGGEYTRYYIVKNGMQYINDIPEEEIKNMTNICYAQAKHNHYDRYLYALYVKYIPEHNMCEFAEIQMLGKVPDKKVMLDMREWEFVDRFRAFVFKDDNRAYNKLGEIFDSTRQKKYYNQGLISWINSINTIQNNSFYLRKGQIPAASEFSKFESTFTNAPKTSTVFTSQIADHYKKYCFPRKLSLVSKTPNLDCPYSTLENNAKLTPIAELNKKYRITVKKEKYTGYGGIAYLRKKIIPIAGIKHDNFSLVEKISDNLFCLRMLSTIYSYPEKTSEYITMLEGETKEFDNNLDEWNRLYFDIEKDEMHYYVYNLHDSKWQAKSFEHSSIPEYVYNTSEIQSTKFIPDKFDDMFKECFPSCTKQGGEYFYILSKVKKSPILYTLYEKGCVNILDRLFKGNKLYELLGVPKTSSNNLNKVLDAPIEILNMMEKCCGITKSKYELNSIMIFLRSVFSDTTLNGLSKEELNLLTNTVINLTSCGKQLSVFFVPLSYWPGNEAKAQYISDNRENIKKLIFAKTSEEINSRGKILNNCYEIATSYHLSNEAFTNINLYKSNQDVLAKYIEDYKYNKSKGIAEPNLNDYVGDNKIVFNT